jgi:hypothetical protein
MLSIEMMISNEESFYISNFFSNEVKFSFMEKIRKVFI